MREAREAFLGRIRAACWVRPEPEPAGSTWQPLHKSRSHEELTAEFARRWQALQGDFHLARGPEELEEILLGILTQFQGRSALVAASALQLIPHLPDLLRGLNITLASPASAQAAQAEVGLTGVNLALAYSGTLVEAGSPEELTASLLPPVHVALVPGKALVYGVDEALEFYERRRPERMVFITGPSRTADIELTLVIGVHGPGRVQAVLLDYI